MKILVINSGSSSIKYQLFQMPEERAIAKGLLEKIGEENSYFNQKSVRGDVEFKKQISDHKEGISFILNILTSTNYGVLSSLNEISAIGHRLVHGGEEFSASALITDTVIEKIKEYADLAPLHNPPNLMGIMACKKFLPDAAQVACFDTAFHHTLPPRAYLYAIPYELYKKYKIRRYGFHGASHLYVSRRLALLLNQDKKDLNIISCHLGNGCSVTAIEKGISVDTSMGFTPLEGLVMGSRSGDIDAAIIFYLSQKGYSLEVLNNLLNKESGVLGISGISNDMRNLLEAREKEDEKAKIAIDIFCYRLKKYIGAYLAVLGKTNAIIFTGGIGENQVAIREESLKGLESLGIKISKEKNESAIKGEEVEISDESSTVKAFVIPTNEESQIAFDTFEILSK